MLAGAQDLVKTPYAREPMAASKPQPQNPWSRPRTVAGLLFLLALALRLLFLWATPDTRWAHSAWYKGDAATWLEWAGALQESRPFEADLPIRPPGTAYLIAALWNGEREGVAALKVVWCLIGALTVVPLYLAARRAFGAGLAIAVGLLCASSTGLMVLSTSLNNETPYLLLVAISIGLVEPIRRRPRCALLTAWACLNAVACLVRAEHILYFALVLAFLLMTWVGTRHGSQADFRGGWRSALARAGLVATVFFLVLLPWHLTAWSQIRRFNTEPLRAGAGTEDAQARLERLLAGIGWSSEALTELDRMPAATRRTARLFITATEGIRGRQAVSAESLEILNQAFGYRPLPLPSHPYLALYGGLNFYLANNAEATAGFSRTPLERPPPLVGGSARYPLALIRGLPPPQLTLTYPPHLEALNDGYRLGWQWIRDHPGDYLRLAGRKLRVFWRGAALGLGGYNLPLGLSGTRRQVDLVVPDESTGAAAWRGGLLVLVLSGAWITRRSSAMVPWTAFLASKLIVTMAFFGYARQGASVSPVVVLLACAAVTQAVSYLGDQKPRRKPRKKLERRQPASRLSRPGRFVVAAALLLLAVEAGRCASRPEVSLDGRRVETQAPFPAHDHRDRRVEVK